MVGPPLVNVPGGPASMPPHLWAADPHHRQGERNATDSVGLFGRAGAPPTRTRHERASDAKVTFSHPAPSLLALPHA